MSKQISINKQIYFVSNNEFQTIQHSEFNNLFLLSDLSSFERQISLIKELILLNTKNLCKDIYFYTISHGGFVAEQLHEYFDHVYIIEPSSVNQLENIQKNIADKLHIQIIKKDEVHLRDDDFTVIIDGHDITINDPEKSNKYTSYKLSGTDLSINIPQIYHDSFLQEFRYFLQENNLFYDNLLELCMIVKNAGDDFENILLHNKHIFDRWTIVDTGSTDQTKEIIKRVLHDKKGTLHEKPFTNFRDSRNHALNLCNKSSKFIINLDDTYLIKGDLRHFLQTIRSDQFADSYSLYIKSNDTEYGSNRIVKSESNLRYKYKLHEVIDPKNNVNVIIPVNHAFLFDVRSEYMEKRTMERKKYDLQILFEMLDEEPHDSRALYYLGQTYNLIHDYEKAYEYFIKRVEHEDEGFIQEKIDACFEAARIANFKLHKSWTICEELYLKAYNMDTSRPDSLYFIGIHYYLNNDHKRAYEYMKIGYQIGYPINCQYSLKPTLSFYYLPKFLVELCFHQNDYNLGLECSHFFLRNYEMIKDKLLEDSSTSYYTMTCWLKIYRYIDKLQNCMKNKNVINQISHTTCYNRHPEMFSECKGIISDDGAKILSFGCATGEEVFTLKELYFTKNKIDGYDISKDAVQMARLRNTNSEIFFFDSLNDILENSYDIIFCLSVLTRNPDDERTYAFEVFETTLKLIHRYLKIGGYICIWNSRYEFTDTDISQKYTPIETTHINSGFTQKFDKTFTIPKEVPYPYVLFRKNII